MQKHDVLSSGDQGLNYSIHRAVHDGREIGGSDPCTLDGINRETDLWHERTEQTKFADEDVRCRALAARGVWFTCLGKKLQG